MGLTDTEIRRTKPRDKTYSLFDGGGMYLSVTPSGGKLWRWKYRFEGKAKLMALGKFPDVSLAQSRERHAQGRRLLATGVDPMAAKKSVKTAEKVATENSFASVAARWLDHWKDDKSERHVETTRRRLASNVLPTLGPLQMTDITAPHIVALVRTIEARGASDVAKRALETTGQIFPEYQGTHVTRLAIKLLALTFVRTSELIEATWSEFDVENARWDIPAQRMKMGTPHIVPLAKQTLEILQMVRELSAGNEYLFPGAGRKNKTMSNNTILKGLERMGYKGRMTGHGFRGLASTILHERGYAHEHIELQLAHAPRNAVSASYNHALYLQPRTRMMQEWADFLELTQRGAKVLPFRDVVA